MASKSLLSRSRVLNGKFCLEVVKPRVEFVDAASSEMRLTYAGTDRAGRLAWGVMMQIRKQL